MLQSLIEASSDALSDWLDKQHGSKVTDNAIFDDLPRFYEAEFFQDMNALNVSDSYYYYILFNYNHGIGFQQQVSSFVTVWCPMYFVTVTGGKCIFNSVNRLHLYL